MACQNDECDSHEITRPVMVFENERGTLSYHCDVCRFAPYAKHGDPVNANWRKRIKPLKGEAAPAGAPVAPPAPESAVNPPAAPAKPKKAAGLFFE